MNLWFDHGVNPSNKTYSYVVLPNKTATEVSSYAAAPPITVLENSADAQAVKETGLNVTGVNFWNDITKSVGGITSNKKASVMTKETANDIEVAVSDPTQANNGTISIEINKSAYGVLSSDSRITVTQLSPTIKMSVNVNGAHGSTLKAKFGFNSGTPITPVANLALNKTVTASSSFSNSDWNIFDSVDGQWNSVTDSKGWTSNSTLTTDHTEWLQVDLGSEATVNKVDLYPRNDGVNSGYGFPVDFTIQVSTDGAVWNTVVSQTGYALPGNAIQSSSFSPVQARYVKVVGTSLRSNPYDNNLYRMQLAEIEIYNDLTFNNSDLALNKTVTASSSVSNSNWNIVNSVDGERNTISGKYGWTSNNNLTANHAEWIKVDLGSEATISRVDLYPRNDAGNVGYGFPVDFTIQVSPDGTTWSTAVTRTGYSLPGNSVQSFGFSPVQARYIKVEGTNLRKNPSDNNLYRMQLAELEVYQKAQTVQIDKIPPAEATLAADITAPTNTGVTVTIGYPADAVVKEYKVGVNGTWTSYTAPVLILDDVTVYARGTDAAGNVSNITNLVVSNIDRIAPVSIATLSSAAPIGSNGWYTSDLTVSLAVYDNLSGVANTEYQVNNGAWISYTGSIPAFGDGIYTVNYRSTDHAGNVEQIQTIEFKIDKTAPLLNVQLDNTSLWPANHQMVTINAALNSSDAASGVASVLLTSITSNEPDSGQGDIQADLGTTATSFRLRAERLGNGAGRIYTIIYTATDKAGNKTDTSVTVTVVHDQSGNH